MPRRRARPSDPAAVMERAAWRRASERAAAADPATWGLSPDVLSAPGAEDVSVVAGGRGRVTRARRSDAWVLLHATGAISGAQLAAADRYVRDRLEAAGVRTGDTLALTPISGLRDDGVRQRMIDASRRVRLAEASVGRAALEVLRAIVEPMLGGEIRVWRELVRVVTGETERHAQAARVRAALDDLLAGYKGIDQDELRRRRGIPRSAY